MAKNSKKNNKKSNKYNAENEIIIGVTTKPKEKARVERKKTTRLDTKTVKTKKSNNNKTVKNKKNIKTDKNNPKKQIINQRNYTNETKEKVIKKINKKKIVVSIIFLLFIVICGTIYYLTTPVFNISSIEVYGNEKNTIDTYISLSKVNIGTTNIFAVTEKGISKNIKENSYVDEVTIEKKLPNILKINIKERKAAYQTENSNSYIYIDEQGYILEMSDIKTDAPIIKGFVTTQYNVKQGQRLLEEDLVKLNIVAKTINYCKYNTIENKITSIDVTDDTNYIVFFEEDEKTVYLGDASNLSERLSLLKTILKNEKNKKIEIFMNGDLNKTDVYIRYSE